MKGIFIDGATDRAIVLVFEEDRVLAQVQFTANRGLFPYIEQALIDAGITPKELDYVAAGRGPGSFTGIRAAQMAAKSMAYALEIPLYGLSSLSLYGDAYPVLLDARSGGAWGQVPGHQPLLVSSDEFLAFSENHPTLLSPEPFKIQTRLDKLGYVGLVEQAEFDLVKIAELLKVQRGVAGSLDPEILYLRKPEAERG